MSSTVYDPSQNEVVIGGYALTGVTSIKVKRGNDSFKVVDGVHPLYSARVRNFTRPFRLNVKLLQTSESNLILQRLYASSEVNANSFLRVEVVSNNGSGTQQSNISSHGYIISAPDLNREMETVDTEWEFVVNALEFSSLTDLIY